MLSQNGCYSGLLEAQPVEVAVVFKRIFSSFLAKLKYAKTIAHNLHQSPEKKSVLLTT